jgi:hypothetical protein
MSFTQSSQGTLATREASSEEQTFITDILKLYQLEPSEKSYRHYADNAVFHDPVSIAKGKESVMSQFNGMPKIFARSDTKGMSPTSSSQGIFVTNKISRSRSSRLINTLAVTVEPDTTLCLQVTDSIQERGC